MITPAYALTATERVLPRLALDFTTAALDARVTLTRTLNTATRVNSSGFIETVNANLPRFDFDPITKVCKGLLIEETRIQTSRATEIIDAWSKSSTAGTSNVVLSPSGIQNADLIYPTSSGNGRQIYLLCTNAPTSGTVAISVFAKPAGKNWLCIYSLDSVVPVAWFNLSTGVKGTAAAGWTNSIEPYGEGFYRCTAVGTAVAGGYVTFGIVDGDNTIAVTANGTDGLYMWGSQVEAGAFSTSYIPNTSSAQATITRNADAVSMTGTNFSSWYNASEGTFVVQFDSATISATGAAVYYAFGASDGTAANFNGAYLFQTTGYAATTVSSSNQVNITVGAVTVNATQKIAYAYKANDFAAALNGATANLDTAGNLPTVDRLTIGALYSGSNIINGHVAKLAYYAPRLINNEVRAFSK
jgi:hypothetical protein